MCTENEPTLLHACRGEPFRYAADCPPLQWDRADLPLVVLASTERGDYLSPEELAFQALTRNAIARVNNQLGHEYFRYLREGENSYLNADVFVVKGRPDMRAGALDGGKLYHSFFSTTTTSPRMVATAFISTDQLVTLTIMHELGHALGLADDPIEMEESLMCSVLGQTSQQFFTDQDIDVLERLYFGSN